jgi:hypothetical protein
VRVVRENRSQRDLTKVAQYEVLGNDAKRNARPGRDDRNVLAPGLSHTALRAQPSQSIVPSATGHSFLNVNPALRTGLLSSGPFGTDSSLKTLFPVRQLPDRRPIFSTQPYDQLHMRRCTSRRYQRNRFQSPTNPGGNIYRKRCRPSREAQRDLSLFG